MKPPGFSFGFFKHALFRSSTYTCLYLLEGYIAAQERKSRSSPAEMRRKKAFNPCCGVCSSQTKRKMKCRTHTGNERKSRKNPEPLTYARKRLGSLSDFTRKTKNALESTDGCHVMRTAPGLLIYISRALCLVSRVEDQLLPFCPSCCNILVTLVSHISPSPNGAINRFHTHVCYRKGCHTATMSAAATSHSVT